MVTSHPSPRHHQAPLRPRHTRLARAASGFSLIELMVVVSIIIILVALLVNAIIENKGPEVRTKAVMHDMQVIVTEYQAVARRPAYHWLHPGRPSPLSESGPNNRITTLVALLAQRAETLELLQKLGSDVFNGGAVLDGWENQLDFVTFNDHELSLTEKPTQTNPNGIDANVFYLSPGASFTNHSGYSPVEHYIGNNPAILPEAGGVAKDTAGDPLVDVVSTSIGNVGFPRKVLAQPFFASPGRDGKWGDDRELVKRKAGQAHDTDLADAAEDNIYSFDLE